MGLQEIASFAFHSVAASIFTQPQSCSGSVLESPPQQEETWETVVSQENAQQQAGPATQIASTRAMQR